MYHHAQSRSPFTTGGLILLSTNKQYVTIAPEWKNWSMEHRGAVLRMMEHSPLDGTCTPGGNFEDLLRPVTL